LFSFVIVVSFIIRYNVSSVSIDVARLQEC